MKTKKIPLHHVKRKKSYKYRQMVFKKGQWLCNRRIEITFFFQFVTHMTDWLRNVNILIDSLHVGWNAKSTSLGLLSTLVGPLHIWWDLFSWHSSTVYVIHLAFLHSVFSIYMPWHLILLQFYFFVRRYYCFALHCFVGYFIDINRECAKKRAKSAQLG